MKVITQKPIEFQSSASGLVNYVATEGNQNIGANYDEFSPEDDFLSNIDGEGGEFIASANGKSKFAKFMDYTPFGFIKNAGDRANLSRKSKDEARVLKAQAKLEEQKAKTAMATEGAKGDIALAKSLATPAPTKGSKKPMSTGVKVAIGVGVALAVTGIVVLIVKMKKK